MLFWHGHLLKVILGDGLLGAFPMLLRLTPRTVAKKLYCTRCTTFICEDYNFFFFVML